MLAPLLAGCGGGGGKTSSDSGKVVVKLGIWPEDTMPGDVTMYEGYKKRFEAANPGITIEPAHYTYSPDTFVSLAQSGQLPTVFETWFTEPQKLIANGLVKDITAELKENGWYDQMNPTIRDLLSGDGKIYGTPRDGYALGLYLNLSLFEQAGLIDSATGLPKYPKTLDELVTVGKTIRDKTGKAGLVFPGKDKNGGWQFSNIAWAYGATLEKQVNGKWVANLNDPKAVQAMKYVHDLKWVYNILTDSPTSEDWNTGFRQLGTGQAAMYIGAQDAVNRPTQVNGLKPDKLSLVPFPSGPAGQFMLMGGTPYMFSNKATDAEVKATLKFLEFIGRSPVVNDTTTQGLKDDARNRVDQGIPVLPVFPAWTSEAYINATNSVVTEYSNVDMKFYQDYFDAIKKTGVLHLEEPACTQDMYSELMKVLQEVFTNKDADIQSLMDKANKNLQAILDTDANS